VSTARADRETLAEQGIPTPPIGTLSLMIALVSDATEDGV